MFWNVSSYKSQCLARYCRAYSCAQDLLAIVVLDMATDTEIIYQSGNQYYRGHVVNRSKREQKKWQIGWSENNYN